MPGKSINRRKKTIIVRNNNTENKKTNNEKVVKNKQKHFKHQRLGSSEDNKNLFVYLIVLAIITFGVFAITFQNDYTNWDDGKYVDENPLIKPLDGKTVKKMFFSDSPFDTYWMGNYHPLTMLTLNINYALAKKDKEGKANPFGFQLVNILLHIFNTLLVFLILLKLVKKKNIAFFAALLFGVHTLHVESVSWIAERKDVLYTVLYLTSLYLYTMYAETRKIGVFIGAFLVFFLSSLAKGQAVSLAVTLILVDYFYDRKLLSPKVIVEKIPFFVVAVIFGFIAIEAQKQGNALQVINSSPIPTRVGVAGFGFTMYIFKLILPINLSAVYPYPDIVNQTIPAYFWLGLITVAGVAFAALKTFKTNKIIFFSIGFFVINIFLLLQLIPVGSAIYADRYSYIPSIGFYLLIGYGITKIKGIKDQKSMFAIIGVYALLLSVLTINRIQVWKDSRTLWEDVVKKQPKSVVAWNNLGSVYNRESQAYKDSLNYPKYEEYKNMAIDCFDTAIERKPDYTSAFYNRGFSKRDLGVHKNDTTLILDAIKDFNNAVASDLTFILAYQERGAAYDWLQDYQRAINDYNTALNYQPNNVEIIVNRGITKGKMGDYDAAIEDFNFVISRKPEFASAYSNRGLAFAFKKDYDAAIADYTKALSLEEEGNTYFNRGLAYYNLGYDEKALTDFNFAVLLNFDRIDLYFYLGMLKERMGDREQACVNFKVAAEKGFQPAIAKYNELCVK